MNLLSMLRDSKIIAILRGLNLEEVLATAPCLLNAGITFIEIPFPQGKVSSATASIIYELRSRYPKLHVGAGTVLSAQQVQEAHTAGAEYILSPNISLPVIHETKRLGMLSMPGALTPSEIVSSSMEGADVVKVFPSGLMGAEYIKALKAPLPNIPLSAVGGIHLDNIQSFFENGIFCVGIGSNIVDRKALKEGNYGEIERLALAYRQKISPTKQS